MVFLTLKKKFSWTYILTVYCCQGNSTQLKKKKRRDMIYKKIKKKLLQPSCMGPHLVMLAALRTVEVTGVTPRTHHSWIKGQLPLQSPTSDRLSMIQLVPLRLRFQRTSQQHAITVEISSPAPAISRKLVGQRTAEA
jgi:hypothetical protein